jgi:glycosyltransferase involved in cell wall biosynthesis
MTSTPDLSVVIASVNGLPYPLQCLDALAAQRDAVDLEVVVADCTGASTAAAIRERHPWVRLVTFDSPQSVPALRSAGFEVARGRLVAVTEDHCVPDPNWVSALIEAQKRTGWAAVGGGVEIAATDRPIDWAVYFCEYANLMSPVPEGPAPAVPGMNVVYDMEQLEPMRSIFTQGLWENVIHDRVREAGFEIGLDPSIVVNHCKHFTIAMFASERFHYSRAYAGNRVAGAGAATRATWALKSLALPPLVVLRVVRAVSTKRRHVGWLLRTAHLVVMFSVIWSLGELVGYVAGPGDSLVKIR